MGFHRDRDGCWYPEQLARARDPDRFIDAGERIGRDHVGAALDEGRDLRAMVGFGFRSVHIACLVAVTARADGGAGVASESITILSR